MPSRASLLIALLLCACGSGQTSGRPPAADSGSPDLPRVKLDQSPPASDGVWDLATPLDGSLGEASPSPLTAPLLLDFEQHDGGLSGTRDWQWGPLSFEAGDNCDTSTRYPPAAAHSGTHVWGTVLNDCYTPQDNAATPCDNQNLQDDSVLRLTVQLPASLTNPTLTYWEWTDVFLPYDWLEVRINGEVVRKVCTAGALSSPPVWHKRSLSLKAHVGQIITVSFHFQASGVINRAGWYIDDLAVSGD